MNYEVLLLSLLAGRVSYCFRYLPLRPGVGNVRSTKCDATDILLGTIGVAPICTLLVVSTAPEVMRDARRFVPTLVGLVVLGTSFYKTRSIIISTLLGAPSYGLARKMLTSLQIKTIILKK